MLEEASRGNEIIAFIWVRMMLAGIATLEATSRKGVCLIRARSVESFIFNIVLEHVHLLDISELDEDHLTLGYIIAELELCGENQAPASEFGAVIERLIATAWAHFAHEEEIMAREEYPGLDPHRDSHRDLITFVEAIATQLLGGQISLNKDLITKLWGWEAGHINTRDREYAEYTRTRKIGAGSPSG